MKIASRSPILPSSSPIKAPACSSPDATKRRQIEAELKEKLSKIPNLEDAGSTHPERTSPAEKPRNSSAPSIRDGRNSAGPHGGGDIHHRWPDNDVPKDQGRLGFDAPLHALITGSPDEKDNRIEVVSAPRFGLVGSEQNAEVRAERSGKGGRCSSDIYNPPGHRGLGDVQAPSASPCPSSLRFDRAGPNIVEVELKPEPGELTTINNKTVIQAQGVRENLRVLLVSGEPHAGERTWRNLLRSDPPFNLVHFTFASAGEA